MFFHALTFGGSQGSCLNTRQRCFECNECISGRHFGFVLFDFIPRKCNDVGVNKNKNKMLIPGQLCIVA